MYSVNLFIYSDLRSGDLFLSIVHHTQHITSPTTKHSALAVQNTTLICVLNRRQEKKIKGGKEGKKRTYVQKVVFPLMLESGH